MGFGPGYDTPEDAAAGAAQLIQRQPSASKYEYVGIIYRDQKDGKFYRSSLATANQPGTATVNELFDNLDPEHVPVAVIHNHVGGPGADFEPRFLSGADSKLEKEGYGKSGPLKMFLLSGTARPEADLRLGTGDLSWARAINKQSYKLEDTSPVLAQFPIAELVKYVDNRSALGRQAAQTRQFDPSLGQSPFAAAAQAARVQGANPLTAALGKQP